MAQIYSKESFDRFGDDLCELLLSYLPFDDKFRYECVSKQWQRVVFIKQEELIIGDSILAKIMSRLVPQDKALKIFQSVLTKCPNIKRIELTFGLNDSIIELIVNCCHYLREFYWESYGISEESIENFFRTFSSRLSRLKFSSFFTNDERFPQTLQLCKNLSIVDFKHFDGLSYLLTDEESPRKGLLKNLQLLRFTYGEGDQPYFKSFVRNYRKSLKSVDVTIHDSCSQTDINDLINGLSQMNSLNSLFLTFDEQTPPLMAIHVKQIGLNCPHIKCLSLIFDHNSVDEFYHIINTINRHFPRLQRLTINVQIDDIFEIMTDWLKNCKRLTHIEINNFSDSFYRYFVNNKFFDKIDDNFPNLQVIIGSQVKVTDKSLELLSKLTKLQTIRLYGIKDITESAAKYLIENCCKLQEFSINDKHLI